MSVLLNVSLHVPEDPRSICNLMLDEAEGRHSISHLALQKLLYFSHGLHLIETKRPLVAGYFEAWKRGPVHPTVYKSFRDAGGSPIKFRAARFNPLTGHSEPLSLPTDPSIKDRVRRVVHMFGGTHPNQLVDISHAAGGPWHFIVDKARTSTAFGLQIPNHVIIERFKYHKVSVSSEATNADVIEDSPFT